MQMLAADFLKLGKRLVFLFSRPTLYMVQVHETGHL
jgi:hypothetical protein